MKMKKVLSFVGVALFVATMTVSCGNNNNEAVDSTELEAVEEVAEENAQPVEAAAESDAMLAAVCPDGNDGSVALFPISLSPSITSYGLTRPTRGFKIMLFKIRDPKSAMAEHTAALRDFFKDKR